MNSEKQEILNYLRKWRRDLVSFVNDVFRIEPTEQQKAILRALQEPSAKVVVKAGRGVGKTAVAAWSIIWHVLLYEDSKTAVTSPTAAQLKDVLMSEIGKWLGKAPLFIQAQLVLTSNRLALKEAENTQFMSARTADPSKPDSLQGFHAEHMYFCVDECFGVADSIFETARAGLTGENSRVLLIGNPTNSNCFAAKACNLDGWQAFTLSCLASPLVNQKYIQELEEEYGKDTDLYKVHVLGEFPSAAICQLIPNDLVDKAIGKKLKVEQYSFAPIILGVDVAYFGDDRSVIFMRQGLASSLLHEYKAIDTMTLAGIVAQCEDQYKADAVFVDVTGVGAGVVDRLKQLGRNPLAVWFGGKPIKDKYKNKRAECWGEMKNWLELGGVLPPNVKGLKEDLTAPEYFYTPDGKIQLERKEDMKKRGRRSPDCFIAKTQILTNKGYKAIESIKEGDLVFTPLGYSPVIRTHRNVVDEVYKNKYFASTGSHKIVTNDGAICSQALREEHILSYLTINQLYKWIWLWYISRFTTARNIGSLKQLIIIMPTKELTAKELRSLYIGRYGKILTIILYPMVIVYITLTTILKIIPLIISLLWSKANIRKSTCLKDLKMKSTGKEIKNSLLRCAQKLMSGIKKKSINILELKRQKRDGKNMNGMKRFVLSAVMLLKLLFRQGLDFVQGNANKEQELKDSEKKFILNLESASFAGKNLSQGEFNDSVPISVQQKGNFEVFNLTLKKHNVYYANDVLVFNCGDSLALTFAQPVYKEEGVERYSTEPKRCETEYELF